MKRFLAAVLVLQMLLLSSCATQPLILSETDPEAAEENAPLKNEKKTETKEEEDKRLFSEDPAEDDTMNVFFVSNSTCFYFTNELYGLLAAAGHQDCNLYLAYYSGCSLKTHYEGIRRNKNDYQLRIVNENGLTVQKDLTLMQCMALENWDVITFDNNAKSFSSGDAQTAIGISEPYFGQLLKFLQERFPQAKYLWHEVWASDIGCTKSTFSVDTLEQRTNTYNAKKGVMAHMMKTYGIGGVPTGDAWEKVRDLPLFTTPPAAFSKAERFTLCSRLMKGELKDDYSHDGDVGGGRYLNACVWFEILTGESCIGNPFRPQYTYNGTDVSLTEEKISVLQNAAHQAVAEFRNS